MRYEVLERGARFFNLSSAALLPDDAGLEVVGEPRGCWGSVGITCRCPAGESSGASAVSASKVCGEGEGVWRRRYDPRIERGICARKETWLTGAVSRCGVEYSWPCLAGESAVDISSMAPATIRGLTCWRRNQYICQTRRKQDGQQKGRHDPYESVADGLCAESLR